MVGSVESFHRVMYTKRWTCQRRSYWWYDLESTEITLRRASLILLHRVAWSKARTILVPIWKIILSGLRGQLFYLPCLIQRNLIITSFSAEVFVILLRMPVALFLKHMTILESRNLCISSYLWQPFTCRLPSIFVGSKLGFQPGAHICQYIYRKRLNSRQDFQSVRIVSFVRYSDRC